MKASLFPFTSMFPPDTAFVVLYIPKDDLVERVPAERDEGGSIRGILVLLIVQHVVLDLQQIILLCIGEVQVEGILLLGRVTSP